MTQNLDFHAASSDSGILRWTSQGDALTLDPHAQNEGPTTGLSARLYDSLVRRGPKMEVVPSMAESWESDGLCSWIFKLRPDIRFQDQSHLTASDVVFSIRRAMSRNSDFAAYLQDVADVRAIDARVVQFRTSVPSPLLPENLINIAIMSARWCAEHGVEGVQDFRNGEDTYAVTNAMGSGPFKLEKREPGVETRIVKHDAWWGWAAYSGNVSAVHYFPIASEDARIKALLDARVQFLLDPPLAEIPRLRADPAIRVKSTNQIRTIFLGMEQGRSELRTSDVSGRNPFSDPRVRKAVALSLDTAVICRDIMLGNAYPAGMITAPGVRGHSAELDRAASPRLSEARKLLEDAGFGDGFSVTLDVPTDRFTRGEAIAGAVAHMLAEIGIRLRLNCAPKAIIYPKLHRLESDFYLLGWGVPTLDSHFVLSHLAKSHSAQDASWNFTGYSNAEFDRLVDAIGSEVDEPARNSMIRQAWGILASDCVYVPLHHQVVTWAMRANVDMPILANDTPHFWAAHIDPNHLRASEQE